MEHPVVVLVPGLLCDSAVWKEQCQALRDAHRADCVVPAFGNLASLTDMARSVLDAVAAPAFALAGHSMGGRVALEIARLAPERIERIALLDTGLDPLAPGAAGEQEKAKRMALLQLAREQGMRAMGRQWARGMVHPDQLESPVFEEVLQMIERQTPIAFEAQIKALLNRPDARPVLQALTCPKLFACGRQDAWSPLAQHEEMQALCPGSRLVVFEDSGHMCTMERPEAVTKALVDWLAG